METVTLTITVDRRDLRDALELRTDMEGSANTRRMMAQTRIWDEIRNALVKQDAPDGV